MKKRYLIPIVLLGVLIVGAAIIFIQVSAVLVLPLDKVSPGIKQTLSFPPANYQKAIFVNGKLLALTIAPDKDLYDQWWYAKDGDSELSLLNFPSDPKCDWKTTYDGFYPRTDGRFDIRKLCLTHDQGYLVYLMAYDWSTGNMEEIAGPLSAGVGLRYVTWNPDFSKGILARWNLFSAETMDWISASGIGPMDVVIASGVRSWNLKEDFPNFQGAEQGSTGNASFPAWSPDGKSIAFFASLDAIGLKGSDFSRFYTKYGLYLMDPVKLQPKLALDGFYFPYMSKWSPDSQWLAFTADRGILIKKSGLWIYSQASNKLLLLSEGDFAYFLWLPGSYNLITVRCNGEAQSRQCGHVEQYDLSDILPKP